MAIYLSEIITVASLCISNERETALLVTGSFRGKAGWLYPSLSDSLVPSGCRDVIEE
jgi:hypothetical protein